MPRTIELKPIERQETPTLAQELRRDFRGDIITPDNETYETSRRIWNAMIDRRPALIARCLGTADILAAVRFARARNLLVSVRGGGHNVAGNAICDGGMVIDLSRMKGIHVDPVAYTAVTQPGLVWGDFDHETQAFGLAMPGGVHSETGIAGFTIGGGFGYLSRKHGLTCDNLLSAEVVTADGKMLRASREQNEDLFWAIRGGGGNFGVVSSFEFRLHPLGQVFGGMVLYPMNRAAEVLRFYRDYVASSPEELLTLLAFITAPPAPHLPAKIHNTPVVGIIACYAGDMKDAERVVGPLRTIVPSEADMIGPKRYCDLQKIIDPANPPGLYHYWKSENIGEISDGLIEVLTEFIGRKPTPKAKLLAASLGGAVSRVGEDETAYPHRSAPFIFNINATWSEPAEKDKSIEWAREFSSALKPFSSGGVYVNFLSDEGEERIKAAYGPKTYERLSAIKAKYDPDNFFRMNQNIKPTM